MTFEFATATRILFGPGKVGEVPVLTRQMGDRALVVTGRAMKRAEPLIAQLSQERVHCVPFSISGEPTTDIVERGIACARQERCNLVIGIGGGSALDGAKAIAALLTNDGGLLDYLEVVGRGKPLAHPAAPFIAIPTTAGTGTEVTRNAVLASPEHRVKASLRSPLMLPRLAVIDPELTYALPPAVTASTGLDALTQLIEPYVSCRANPVTDALCLDGIPRVARSLRRAWIDGSDQAARTDMALASLFGGLALANAGLGAVHGFAAPIGGMFPAPHGAVCAALLPYVMEANARALQRRAPDSTALRRYRDIARLLTGRADVGIEDGVEWVRESCHTLSIPSLRRYELTPQDVSTVVEKAAQASSMKTNPIVLTREELEDVLRRAL